MSLYCGKTNFNSLRSVIENNFCIEILGKIIVSDIFTVTDTFDLTVYNSKKLILKYKNFFTVIDLNNVSENLPDIINDWHTETEIPNDIYKTTGIRALIPFKKIQFRESHISIRDNLLKKNCQLIALEASVSNIKGELEDTFIVLSVKAVRGYEKSTSKVINLLKKNGFSTVNDHFLKHIITVNAARRLEYFSKPLISLDPELPVVVAYERIFRKLFQTIEINIDGLLKEIDIEFLHDFRVSVRRTRSLLKFSKEVLNGEYLKEFEQGFRHIQKTTNKARDLDVFIDNFKGYKTFLDDSYSTSYNNLLEYLQKERSKEQIILYDYFDSENFYNFFEKWKYFLDYKINDCVADRITPFSEIKPYSLTLILNAYKKARKYYQKMSIDNDNSIHKVRIAFKQVRYLFEFFNSLYKTEEIDKLIKTLKKNQDIFGRFNDICFQLNEINELEDNMVNKNQKNMLQMIKKRLIEELKSQRHICCNAGKDFFKNQTISKIKELNQ